MTTQSSIGTPAGDVTDAQRTVVLTAHPLQRVGAFTLAALARVGHPDQLGPEKFDETTGLMTEHLLSTAKVEGAKEPGGFWLWASYLLWPNAAGLNTTNRKKLPPQERRDRITAGRHHLKRCDPRPTERPGAASPVPG